MITKNSVEKILTKLSLQYQFGINQNLQRRGLGRYSLRLGRFEIKISATAQNGIYPVGI